MAPPYVAALDLKVELYTYMLASVEKLAIAPPDVSIVILPELDSKVEFEIFNMPSKGPSGRLPPSSN